MEKELCYKVLSGTITCETGLHIGGNKGGGIGEVDNPVIKNPVTHLPYIPGSSLKGKIRSLLELRYNKISTDKNGNGTPYTGDDLKDKYDEKGDLICKGFGSHLGKYESGITRFLFRDARMLGDEVELENKFENTINRKTGATINGGLRETERVVEGTQFTFEIVIRYFDETEYEKLFILLNEGLDLLQKDYLGGSGSRGYGKVRIDVIS